MSGRQESAAGRTIVYCIVPRQLASSLHELLRRHFRGDPGVEVVVEQRGAERRRMGDRRVAETGLEAEDRRLVRNASGRRVGDRRAPAMELTPRELPRRARRFAHQIAFVERIEPSGQTAEDLDTARIITRIQAGDREAFAVLYARYFDRVYGYLRPVLKNHHEAEDVAQQVFMDVLIQIRQYERQSVPFRAWLFTLARNQAVGRLRRLGRLEISDLTIEAGPSSAARSTEPSAELTALDWISDRELLRFMERLPLSQRQVLLLRHMLGFSVSQTAQVLDRTPNEVRILQHRGHAVLRERFLALGIGPRYTPRAKAPIRFRQMLVLRHRRFALGAGSQVASNRSR